MKLLLSTCLLMIHLIGGGYLSAQEAESGFKKDIFYNAMAGKNEDAVNKQLDILKTVSMPEKNAYEGALLMKKAGWGATPKKKLNLFKEGHNKFEAVLQKDSANAEYRFLRLIIQEHAPGALGYKGDLERDKLYIKNNFKKMQPAVQEAVLHYSNTSKILKPSDF